MTTELTMLAWALILAVFQIALVATLRTKELGLAYNMGPRDTPAAPPGKITARLQRAQANLFETLPVFAVAVLLAHIGGRENNMTAMGAQIYLAARVLYVPAYALGMPVVRTLVWGVSVAGIVMIIGAIV